MSNTCRYIMIGGFLGSGKTTTVARLAQNLSATLGKAGERKSKGVKLLSRDLNAKMFATVQNNQSYDNKYVQG